MLAMEIFPMASSWLLRRSFLGGLPCCLETKLPSRLHLNARERLERSYVFVVRPHCKSDTHPTILRSHGCFTHARTLQSSDSTQMSRCGKLLICWQRGPGQKQKNGCQLDTFSLYFYPRINLRVSPADVTASQDPAYELGLCFLKGY